MHRIYRKLKEQRAKQMDERRRFNECIKIERRHTHGDDDDAYSTTHSATPPSSPPPYSSAPTLAEIEKHESEAPDLRIPLRSTSISASMYPTLSQNDIPSYLESNRSLRNSQIYNTTPIPQIGDDDEDPPYFHEYILPPFECPNRRPKIPAPKPLVRNPVENFEIVKKSVKEIIRPSWFNRVIFQHPTLLFTKTVELKVPAGRKSEFQKFSYYQLKKFKGSHESDHVTIFNPKTANKNR